MQTTEIKVWDPLIRTGHWLLATLVIIAWFVDEPVWLHTWLGYIAIALILVRIVWGFVGPDYARFASFVRGPRVTFSYFADLIRFSSKRYLGHSPAGAVMIVALLSHGNRHRRNGHGKPRGDSRRRTACGNHH